jgi:hypothetical protein
LAGIQGMEVGVIVGEPVRHICQNPGHALLVANSDSSSSVARDSRPGTGSLDMATYHITTYGAGGMRVPQKRNLAHKFQ